MTTIANRRRITLLVIALALVPLTGCAASVVKSSPPASTAASATPKVTVDSAVTMVSMSGSSLSTRTAGGATIASVPFSEGSSAIIGMLTKVLRSEPKVVQASDGSMCIDPIRTYSWSDAGSGVSAGVIVSEREKSNPPRPDWTVQVDSRSVSGVKFQTSNGLSVGQNTDSFVASLPAFQKANYNYPVPEGGSDTHVYVFDVSDTRTIGGISTAFGGVAISDSSLLVRFVAPTTATMFAC